MQALLPLWHLELHFRSASPICDPNQDLRSGRNLRTDYRRDEQRSVCKLRFSLQTGSSQFAN